jgi:signal transduction histidine kinase
MTFIQRVFQSIRSLWIKPVTRSEGDTWEGMSSVSEKSRWWSVALFAVGVTGFVTLRLLGKADLIDWQAECLLRLLIVGGLGSAVVIYSLCLPIRPWLRLIILLTIATALAETLFDVAQTAPIDAGAAAVEGTTLGRRVLRYMLVTGWVVGGIAIIYLAIVAGRRRDYTSQLISQLQNTQDDLKRSNERLANTLERLENSQRQLVQRERLSTLGKMASGVAHDLNNTLAPVVMYSRLLAESGSGYTEKEKRWLATIEQCSRDAVTTVDGLKQFYTRDVSSDSLRRLKMNDLVRQSIEMTKPKWKDEPEKRGGKISISTDLAECSPVRVNPTEIRVVITNLIFNAVEAMPNGGTLRFHLYEEEEAVVLSVSDSGVGMSDEARVRCFEPFFTNKPRGSGLGLSICQGIIDRHSGTLAVESDSGGTTFLIRLPISDATRSSPAATPSRKLDDQGYRRILLVEDDELVRESTTSLLSTLGSEVVAVPDGRSGVAAFLNQGPFDLVITDLGMPGMDGRAVVRAIRQHNPAQKVAIMSGWWEPDARTQFADGEAPDIVLHKSEMSDQLIALMELLAQPEAD